MVAIVVVVAVVVVVGREVEVELESRRFVVVVECGKSAAVICSVVA